MSEINDKLFELDKKKDNTISMALERQAKENGGSNGGNGGPENVAKEPAVTAPGRTSVNIPWFWMLLMSVLMAATVTVVVMFVGSTVTKMHEVRNSGDQLSELLEEHVDNFNKLKDHVDAMEGEFRRAFQKDRAEAVDRNNAVVQRLSELQANIDAAEQRLREEILKYKSQVVDSQTTTSKIERDYQQLNTELQSLREQFNAVQLKVLEMTVE